MLHTKLPQREKKMLSSFPFLDNKLAYLASFSRPEGLFLFFAKSVTGTNWGKSLKQSVSSA